MVILVYPIVNTTIFFQQSIVIKYALYFNRIHLMIFPLKPPFILGIFPGELLVITRWYFTWKLRPEIWGIPFQPGDVAPLQHRAEGRLRARREVAQRADVASWEGNHRWKRWENVGKTSENWENVGKKGGEIPSFLCFQLFSCWILMNMAFLYSVLDVFRCASRSWVALHYIYWWVYGLKCTAPHLPWALSVHPTSPMSPEPTWVGQTMPKHHMSDEFYQLVPS